MRYEDFIKMLEEAQVSFTIYEHESTCMNPALTDVDIPDSNGSDASTTFEFFKETGELCNVTASAGFYSE